MSKIVDELIEERILEYRAHTAEQLLKRGDMSVHEIAEIVNLPIDVIEKLTKSKLSFKLKIKDFGLSRVILEDLF